MLISKSKLSLLAGLPFLISIALPLTGSTLFTRWILLNSSFFHEITSVQWIVFYSITAIAMGLMLTPTTFVAVLSGYLLGWQAIPYVVISYATASVIGFFIGKKMDQGKINRLLKHYPKAAKVFNNIHDVAPSFVFACRLSPVLPFAFTNVLLASINTSFKQFITYGTLGMLPRTLLAIWAGKQTSELIDLESRSFEWSAENLLLLGLLLSSMIILTWVLKKIVVNKSTSI